ncbi:LADA_0H09824g1_1 [Lachancea dasiensis]|uniref:Required for respiratory growth protein 8, mitochondrial n=1 Tax=Lachancea dasiensis TaxID=1072105 RepID=A0A1G4K2Y4_9SACH|nr:LADA_0H09824g1_1 [Lachancea dasiensis]
MVKSKVLGQMLESLGGKKHSATNIKEAHRPDCDVSPLISNFAKWSDKPKRLYFRENSEWTQVVDSSNLRGNLFAELLSSPMRMDRITRLRAPCNLLTQIKLGPKAESVEGDKGQFELAPAIPPTKGDATSYVNNNETSLRKNGAAFLKWIPTSTFNSTIRHIGPQDVIRPTQPIVDSCKAQLINEVQQKISFTISNGESETTFGPPNRRIKVISDSNETDTIIVHPELGTTFNLKDINDSELQRILKMLPNGIHLDFAVDKQLCMAIYRLLQFGS